MHAQRVDEQATTYEWQHMTRTDFSQLDRSRCVVMVTCSPLEVHGPHLPVAADNAEAEALSRRTRELLTRKHPELVFLLLPPIHVAADLVPHRGSIPFRPSTVIRVIEDLGNTLAKQGFQHIWVGNFHGGPRHFLAIEAGAERVNRRHHTTMISTFSLLTRKLTSGTSSAARLLEHLPGLNSEILQGDTHGGAIETSLLLHILGPHVRSDYTTLPRMTLDLKRKALGLPPAHARPGKASLVDLVRSFSASMHYFLEESYTGDPSRGTAELGQQILEVFSELSADTLSDVWTGKIPASDCHSALWPLRHLFLSETLQWLVERVLSVRNPIFTPSLT